MAEHADRKATIEKLGELIKGIDYAMLTTIEADGSLRSRPMATQDLQSDGTLWFFTKSNAPEVDEILHDPRVNVSYADVKNNRYVSVSGTAKAVRDQRKAQQFWNPAYKAWFPDGLDDPELALLQIDIDKAEYWDSSSSTMVHLAGFIKALATGQSYQGGESKKVHL